VKYNYRFKVGRVGINQIVGRGLLSAGMIGLFLCGCSSNPPPPAPAPVATIQPTPMAIALSPVQMTRLCNVAPDTCHHVQTGQPLTLTDVKAMASVQVEPNAIIAQIQASKTAFHMTADQILDLKSAGVNDGVINYMLNTPNTIAIAAPATAPVESPYPPGQTPPPPLEESETASPGPDYVWVGGDWAWNNGWVWVGGRWAIPPYPHAFWYRGGWRDGRHGYYHDRGHWR